MSETIKQEMHRYSNRRKFSHIFRYQFIETPELLPFTSIEQIFCTIKFPFVNFSIFLNNVALLQLHWI